MGLGQFFILFFEFVTLKELGSFSKKKAELAKLTLE
jgi:hypothetical protein